MAKSHCPFSGTVNFLLPLRLKLVDDTVQQHRKGLFKKYQEGLSDVLDTMKRSNRRIISLEIDTSPDLIQKVISGTSYSSHHVQTMRLTSLYAGSFPCPIFPNIQILELSKCTLDWGRDALSVTPHLRRLAVSISHNDKVDDREDFLRDIPGVLRFVPVLEDLSLEWCVSLDRSDAPGGLSLISLPKLSRLHIADESAVCRDFMDHLVVPRTCHLSQRSGIQYWPAEIPLDSPLRILRAHHRTQPSALDFIVGKQILTICWPSGGSSEDGDHNLTFHATNAPALFTHTARLLLPSVALSSVTVNWEGIRMPAATWHAILAHADVERFYIIDERCASGWFDAFVEAEASGIPFLQRMATLVIGKAFQNRLSETDAAGMLWARFLAACQHRGTDGALRTVRTVDASAG